MARATWCWRRWIAPGAEEEWTARLAAAGHSGWSFAQRPGRVRVGLEVYFASQAAAKNWSRQYPGKMVALHSGDWLAQPRREPLQISPHFLIHDSKPRGKAAGELHLVIPHGMAFGSGEHATTFMLLRALARRPVPARVLDLGTGSGVLALAARRFGARHITATDFDPDAVRTARQNEARNFRQLSIVWCRADVRALPPNPAYDLIIANLFSELLIEAAPQIASSLASKGSIWLSGILRQQQDEVIAAYRRTGVEFARATRRGKWIMLRFESST